MAKFIASVMALPFVAVIALLAIAAWTVLWLAERVLGGNRE